MDGKTKGFAELATEMNLSPTDATLLTVLARHAGTPNKSAMDDIQFMEDRLQGEARRVARVLLGKDKPHSASVESLVSLLRSWVHATSEEAAR